MLLEENEPNNTALGNELWPPLITKIQPAYVWVLEDRISLKWTGGFSPDSLWAYMHAEDIDEHGESFPKGITVHDSTNTIPLHPYVVDTHKSPKTE